LVLRGAQISRSRGNTTQAAPDALIAEVAQVLAVGFRRLQLREQNLVGRVDVGVQSEASSIHAKHVAGAKR
jgi:hypothetical protein